MFILNDAMMLSYDIPLDRHDRISSILDGNN